MLEEYGSPNIKIPAKNIDGVEQNALRGQGHLVADYPLSIAPTDADKLGVVPETAIARHPKLPTWTTKITFTYSRRSSSEKYARNISRIFWCPHFVSPSSITIKRDSSKEPVQCVCCSFPVFAQPSAASAFSRRGRQPSDLSAIVYVNVHFCVAITSSGEGPS